MWNSRVTHPTVDLTPPKQGCKVLLVTNREGLEMNELDYEADAIRINTLRAAIADYEAEIKDIAARYADVPNDKYIAGDFILTVSQQSRFDPATAARALTKAQFASIQKLKPDAALAKAVLNEKLYAKTLKPTAKSVTAKRVTDI